MKDSRKKEQEAPGMKEISFEKALEKLETIVEELESGDLPLDASLKKYEEGIKIARACHGQLDEAKEKIETLMKDEDGRFETKTFEDK
jgi:exodeoxyribonuclease VII small subunit